MACLCFWILVAVSYESHFADYVELSYKQCAKHRRRVYRDLAAQPPEAVLPIARALERVEAERAKPL